MIFEIRYRGAPGRRSTATAGVGHDVITVPGALEIPAAVAIALDAAESAGRPYDAAIARCENATERLFLERRRQQVPPRA